MEDTPYGKYEIKTKEEIGYAELMEELQ